MSVNAMEQVILALDFPSLKMAESFLPNLPELVWVKVGMELYYHQGPQVIYRLKELGYKVFLDLKLHDIPNTVKQATRALVGSGVDMLNFHAFGGRAMLEAAVEGAHQAPGPNPLLIGVTILTSTDQQVLTAELGINRGISETVLAYAHLVQAAGLDGVVCSAQETKLLKKELGPDLLTVTPGIRLAGANPDDQKRITTPQEAKLNGSDFLVIGRALTQAKDPQATWSQIKAQLITAAKEEVLYGQE